MHTECAHIARANEPKLMPDYETSVGAMLAMLEGYDGNEIGTPSRLPRSSLTCLAGTNSQTTLFSGAMRSLASRWEKRRKRRQLPNGKRSASLPTRGQQPISTGRPFDEVSAVSAAQNCEQNRPIC
jgi:hypothetical protein